MTNAEKFQEIFNLPISEMPSDPCDIIDENICINADGCENCPLYHFWEKEFQKYKVSRSSRK